MLKVTYPKEIVARVFGYAKATIHWGGREKARFQTNRNYSRVG